MQVKHAQVYEPFKYEPNIMNERGVCFLGHYGRTLTANDWIVQCRNPPSSKHIV
jgi:hypothetical protein